MRLSAAKGAVCLLLLGLLLNAPGPRLVRATGAPSFAPSFSPTLAPTGSPATQVENSLDPAESLSFDDQFGSSVALSGRIAMVGAEARTGADTDCGTAFGFQQDATNLWSADTGLDVEQDAAECDSGDFFGSSMVMSTNGLLLVGAPGDDGGAGGTNSGTVYAYAYSSGSFTLESSLTGATSTFGAGEGFGAALSVNDDGSFLVVGAPSFPGGGCVYIFERSGGSWQLDTQILNTTYNKATWEDGATFGASVSLNDTYLGVGAPEQDGKGAVYFFRRKNDGSWKYEDTVSPSGLNSAFDDANFGTSVAVIQNEARTGEGLAVACAPGSSTTLDDEGKCWVYTRSSGSWSQQYSFQPSNSTKGTLFGTQALLTGGQYVYVSAPGNAQSVGVLYVFTITTTEATQITRVKDSVSTDTAGTLFGDALSVDGRSALVGAPDDTNAGAATVFDFACTGSSCCETDNTAESSDTSGTGRGVTRVSGIATCETCGVGEFGNLSVCADCPDGYVSNTTGSTTCSACGAGEGSNGARTSCTQCPIDTYSTGKGPCLDCPGGKLSLAGSTLRSDCFEQNPEVSFALAFVGIVFVTCFSYIFVCTARVRETVNQERLTRFKDMVDAIITVRQLISKAHDEVAAVAAWKPKGPDDDSDEEDESESGSGSDGDGDEESNNESSARKKRRREKDEKKKSPTMQAIRRHGRLIAGVVAIVIIVVFIWVATMLRVVADAYLILKSASFFTDVQQLKDIIESIAKVLDTIELGWTIRSFGVVLIALFEFSFADLAFSGLGVTCSGAQGISVLVLDLFALLFICFVLEYHLFELAQSILRSTFTRLAAVKRHEQKTREKAKMFLFAAFGLLVQSGARFLVQTIAGFISFTWAKGNDICDDQSLTGDMDTQLALVTNILAVLLLPAAFQLLLTVAIPGLPHNSNMFTRVEPIDQDFRPEWLDKAFTLSIFRGIFAGVTWQCHRLYQRMHSLAGNMRYETLLASVGGAFDTVACARSARVLWAARDALASIEARYLVQKRLDAIGARYAAPHVAATSSRLSLGRLSSARASESKRRDGDGINSDNDDTNDNGAAAQSSPPAQRASLPRFTSANPMFGGTDTFEWYYKVNPVSTRRRAPRKSAFSQKGPHSGSAMRALLQDGVITDETQVRLRIWPRFISVAALRMNIGEDNLFLRLPRLPVLLMENEHIHREHLQELTEHSGVGGGGPGSPGPQNGPSSPNRSSFRQFSRRFSGRDSASTSPPMGNGSPAAGEQILTLGAIYGGGEGDDVETRGTNFTTDPDDPSPNSPRSPRSGSRRGLLGLGRNRSPSSRRLSSGGERSGSFAGRRGSDAIGGAAIQMQELKRVGSAAEAMELDSRRRASMFEKISDSNFKLHVRPTERVAYRKVDGHYVWLEMPSPVEILYSIWTVLEDDAEEIFQHMRSLLHSWIWACQFKIWTFVSLTFGTWDDDLISAMRIKWKQLQFSDIIVDGIDMDTNNPRIVSDRQLERRDVIARAGATHALAWQTLPGCVAISKFAEAMNVSPLVLFGLYSSAGATSSKNSGSGTSVAGKKATMSVGDTTSATQAMQRAHEERSANWSRARSRSSIHFAPGDAPEDFSMATAEYGTEDTDAEQTLAADGVGSDDLLSVRRVQQVRARQHHAQLFEQNDPLDLGKLVVEFAGTIRASWAEIDPEVTGIFYGAQVVLHTMRGVDDFLERSRVIAWFFAMLNFGFLIAIVLAPNYNLLAIFSLIVVVRALPQAASVFFDVAINTYQQAQQDAVAQSDSTSPSTAVVDAATTAKETATEVRDYGEERATLADENENGAPTNRDVDRAKRHRLRRPGNRDEEEATAGKGGDDDENDRAWSDDEDDENKSSRRAAANLTMDDSFGGQLGRSFVSAGFIGVGLSLTPAVLLTAAVSDAVCSSSGCDDLPVDVRVMALLLYAMVASAIMAAGCAVYALDQGSYAWFRIQLRMEMVTNMFCFSGMLGMFLHSRQVHDAQEHSGASKYLREVDETMLLGTFAILALATGWHMLVTRHMHRLCDPERAAREAELRSATTLSQRPGEGSAALSSSLMKRFGGRRGGDDSDNDGEDVGDGDGDGDGDGESGGEGNNGGGEMFSMLNPSSLLQPASSDFEYAPFRATFILAQWVVMALLLTYMTTAEYGERTMALTIIGIIFYGSGFLDVGFSHENGQPCGCGYALGIAVLIPIACACSVPFYMCGGEENGENMARVAAFIDIIMLGIPSFLLLKIVEAAPQVIFMTFGMFWLGLEVLLVALSREKELDAQDRDGYIWDMFGERILIVAAIIIYFTSLGVRQVRLA